MVFKTKNGNTTVASIFTWKDKEEIVGVYHNPTQIVELAEQIFRKGFRLSAPSYRIKTAVSC